MTSAILELIDIRKEYNQTGLDSVEVFSDVNLTLSRGEMVGLFSPSGAGKTTLLQIAGLLDSPTSGNLRIDGRDINFLSDLEKTRIRNNEIGFVYQFHNLLPEFSALENICIPQWCLGVRRKEAEKKGRSLLNEVGLSHRENHRPAELSGGEQQRVALCRALINDPKILLADEPTGNLDLDTSHLVFALILSLVKEKNLTALIVSHNLSLVEKMDRVIKLNGRSVEAMIP
tara:strand:- start:1148 stop:1837 length:690 start_codon:yes stop_codon:yes gene_type:complete